MILGIAVAVVVIGVAFLAGVLALAKASECFDEMTRWDVTSGFYK